MEARLAFQENAMKQFAERCMAMEAAIGQIVEHAQRQDMVIESSRASIQGLVDEVNIHRDNFQKIGMIMQIHEQYIVRGGVITQEMGQYINALLQDNQNKSMRIESMMNELRGQAEILLQHQMGQEVITEVMKCMMAGHYQGQPKPQPQGVAGTGPIVTEVDDDSGTDPNFPNAPSPNAGPPNNGGFGVPMSEVLQVPTSMEIVPRI